jgi:RNA polymerase sigma-70 factor (ECF subfamily)
MIFLPLEIAEMEDESNKAFIANMYEEYRWIMYKMAYPLLWNDQDVEDAVNECIANLIGHVLELRLKSSCNLQLYIVSSIRNTCFNRLRKRERTKEDLFETYAEFVDSQASPDMSLEDTVELSASMAEYEDALSAMPASLRSILTEKFVIGMTDKEIAQSHGIKPESVSSYVSKARRKAIVILKDRMNRKEDE